MSSTGRAAIHQLTIDKIKVGTVTRDQMQLEFPEGIFVVDAKQGESYIVGPGGVPTAKTLLIGESAVAAAEFEKEMAERFFAERST